MGAVKHIALIKFKASASSALVDELWNEIKRLPSLVPGIADFAGGLNNSPEGLNQGFTHGFVMTFQDSAARDALLTAAILLRLLDRCEELGITRLGQLIAATDMAGRLRAHQQW